MSELIQKYAEINGIRLAYVERGNPRQDAPSLLFVHATGFHSRVWDYHAEAFPDLHVIAVDQRGHGLSDAVAVTHWKTFCEDMVSFVEQLGLKRMIGIAHSMGSHGLITAAARHHAFDSLLLLDPTISNRESYNQGDETLPGRSNFVSKRRGSFESPEDMMNRLRGKASFPLYDERIFEDYCRHGLQEMPDGTYQLRCKPEVEAAVYLTARSNGAIYDSIKGVECPVTIVRAKTAAPDSPMDFANSPTDPGLVREFANAREIHWSDCTHFIPMERPDAVVALIREAVDAWPQSSA